MKHQQSLRAIAIAVMLSWTAIIGWAAASTIVVWLLFDKVLTLKLGNELLRLPL